MIKRIITIYLLAIATNAHSLNNYQPVNGGLSENLIVVGSDTLLGVMEKWAAEFKKIYPNVTFQIKAEGSSTAPIALAEDEAHFGPMSRKMKSKEKYNFEVKHGYKPTEVRVAIDALAVYVHKDNKIKGLSIPEVDAIFSRHRKCGLENTISSWKDLGVAGEVMNLYGRGIKSGTNLYFKEKALCEGVYKNNMMTLKSSAELVKKISEDRNGIGYSGIGYKTKEVRAVPISEKKDGKFVEVTADMVAKGKYPLGRYLFVYINKDPSKPLEQTKLEFLKYILSKQGQNVVQKEGFVKLPAIVADKELQALY